VTTTPDDPATAKPGRPPVADLATWQAARDELLAREKAHTHEGDAIAAARRRLPMVEFDGKVEAWQDTPAGWPEGHGPCWYWRGDADGNATWGPASRPVPQWTRPGATPEQTLGRQGHDH
jgi:hypothetical protein